MRKSDAILAIGIVFAAFSVISARCAEDTDKLGERHIEEAGGYSFKPPKSWKLKKDPDAKYTIAFGAAVNGFSPNINIMDESYPGTLKEYVKANLAFMQMTMKNFKKVDESEVKLDSGESTVRLIITSEQENVAVRQSFYIVKGPQDKIFAFVCTVLAEKGEDLDKTFEASAKTFALNKK